MTPPMLPADPYDPIAEFVEHGLGPAWEPLEDLLASTLAAAPRGPGAAVVDVGAGGGRGVLLAGPAGSDPIHAVEPSVALRTVLQARLALDPELRARTTVHPTGVLEADLPARWSALLAMHMLGHLDADDRARLWDLAAERLLPGAPVLATVQPPESPVAVPEADWGSTHVGEHEIVATGRAEPDGPDSVVWTVTYRVLAGDEELRRATTSHKWHVLGVDRLVEELRAAGLDAAPVAGHVVRAVAGDRA